MQVSIKLENKESFIKMKEAIVPQIIKEGELVIEKHISIIINDARSKIKERTGKMASLLKGKIDGKGRGYVVARIGTLGATREDAIAFNAYEYGHAAPNDAGGVKIVQGKRVLKNSLQDDKKPFREDMSKMVKRVCDEYK
jgi:hypothetical protein